MDILIKILEALLAFLKREPAVTGEAPSTTGEAPSANGVSSEQLKAIYGCSEIRATTFAPLLNEAMGRYQIDTPLRQAHFLAQIGHESGRLQHTREIWGPTAAQTRYEGRKDLGNTEPGDGSRYRGRGLIQVTGRANYARASKALGQDFVGNPEMLESPRWAAMSAAEFWGRNGCNALADADDVLALTKRINGGENGLADRKKLLDAAKRVLGA